MANTIGNRSPDNLVKKPDDTRTKEEQLLNAPYGQQGAIVINEEDTAIKGEFYCIIAIRDDVVLDASLTRVNWSEFDGTASPFGNWDTDIPLPVGLPFYGNFESVGLADQSAIAGYCSTCPKLIAYLK